jgi:hypothetical protein
MSFKKSCCAPSIKTDMTELLKDIDENMLISSQKGILEYFKKYKSENYISLSQKDFDYGTRRITKPGYYILKEDIVFHPNPDNDFKPTASQIKSGLYPVPGPYNLNFFAALTIETEGVVVDLNGHTIKQSKEHFLMQRFYANIELASAPFIGVQGPSPGISGAHASGKKVAIINGTLGLSSHHGIHGNGSKDILLAGLNIVDFQVAGISLNGLSNAVFKDITIKNSSKDVAVLSSYSQAIFALPFVERLLERKPDATIYIQGREKGVKDIYDELKNSIEKSRRKILKTGRTSDKLFHNEGGLSDTNIYGLTLNVNGVLVGGFLKERPDKPDIGNDNIYLQGVTIDNICSHSREIVGLSDSTILGKKVDSYGRGKPAITGPVGGLFNYRAYTGRGGNYISNPLGNAQALLGLHSSRGTVFFTRPIIDWMKGDINISEVLADRNISEILGGDSMNHKMKGNIGFFVSGGKNVICKELSVTNVANTGRFESGTKRGGLVDGEKAFTHALVACEDISINGESYTDNTFI